MPIPPLFIFHCTPQSVLSFLNVDCNTIHGNIRTSSIFVNAAGEWKLGGFELLSRMDEEFPQITVRLLGGGVLFKGSKGAKEFSWVGRA